MCVVWSYLDADLVYSGGEDGTVRPWRPSIQQNRQPPAPGTLRIKRELNARLAIRQRADLFVPTKLALLRARATMKGNTFTASLGCSALGVQFVGNLQKGELNRKNKRAKNN